MRPNQAILLQFGVQNRPLRLWVRHYLSEDGAGFARIVASRLTDLRIDVVNKREVAE